MSLLPGEKCCRGERSQSLVVLNVDGGTALDGHVEHVDVVVHHHDVGHSATICVLYVITVTIQKRKETYVPAGQNCPPWPKSDDRFPPD